METRLNVTFSPVLTLELYMQPLIESDAFSAFREFAGPRQLRKVVYGVDVGRTPFGGVTGATLDRSGRTGRSRAEISDRRSSSTFRSLRGNAVLRWEYHPGSTLFLVWTRSGSSSLTVEISTSGPTRVRCSKVRRPTCFS